MCIQKNDESKTKSATNKEYDWTMDTYMLTLQLLDTNLQVTLVPVHLSWP